MGVRFSPEAMAVLERFTTCAHTHVRGDCPEEKMVSACKKFSGRFTENGPNEFWCAHVAEAANFMLGRLPTTFRNLVFDACHDGMCISLAQAYWLGYCAAKVEIGLDD